MNIDFSKYKRVFTFGCSFTKYHYPTWANILSECMPGTEFINLGQCGGGNLYISNRMTQANRTYNFCETDLVATMWSTYCREDRYVYDRWITPGNVFSQGIYDEQFVKKFCEPLGYLIKDLSIIDLATAYMSALPCTYIDMLSVAPDHQIIDVEDPIYKSVVHTYKELLAHFDKPTLYAFMGNQWAGGITYIHDGGGETEPRWDYHPNTLSYCKYLEAIGIPLTAAAIEYAEASYAKSLLIKRESEFPNHFGSLNPNTLAWNI